MRTSLLFYMATAVCVVVILSCGEKKKESGDITTSRIEEEVVSDKEVNPKSSAELPYSGDESLEKVYDEYGKHTIRLIKDESLSFPQMVKNKKNCFVVMSKKDYYLYVYEPQGEDTVMVARYDCCFSLKKGNKQKVGDMRTPHTTMDNPFTLTEIVDASTWDHDFGDGRGSILSYGHWFHRLDTHGHKGIGIHGSTNNAESVPGRASEGCIRLLDEDIIDFKENYAHVGMKVVIKAEEVDDLPFEITAMKKQDIKRKRHLNPAKCLTNEQVEQATPVEVIRARHVRESAVESKNKTLEELSGKDSQEINDTDEMPQKVVNPNKNKTLEELKGKRSL